MSEHLDYEFFVSLIKSDSRKLRDFLSLIHTDTSNGQLKLFVGVLASQMSSTEYNKGERLMMLLQQTVVFLKRTLTCCGLCVPFFIDSKVQLQYLGSPNTAVPPL